MRRVIYCVGVLFCLIAVNACLVGESNLQATDKDEAQTILARMFEVNRYWLVAPSESVRSYRYTLNMNEKKIPYEVDDPQKAPGSLRMGITWHSLLNEMASKPYKISSSEVDGQYYRFTIKFEKPFRGHAGNGISGTWYGYFNNGGDVGYLIVDKDRLTPVRSLIGREEDTFSDYVAVDDEHYVPLKMKVRSTRKDGMSFDWYFRLYKPGLWLFDHSYYRDQIAASLEDVKINGEPAVVDKVSSGTLEQETIMKAGDKNIRALLEANALWLQPSLESRKGLEYIYRQEPPYGEHIWFGERGEIMVRLEATKESPTTPTQTRFWSPVYDQVAVQYHHDSPFVAITPLSQDEIENPLKNRSVQRLAMGLGLDCALTRLARDPDSFWTERIKDHPEPGYDTLVLHPTKNVRLYTGTMLIYISWSYMHDVSYNRSDIVFDPAMYRPVSEKDYNEQGELVGEYTFIYEAAETQAPSRIEAVIPYEKDGHDKSLEMTAEFQMVNPQVWLLKKVESHFRNTTDSSMGSTEIVPEDMRDPEAIEAMVSMYKNTRNTLAAINNGRTGSAEWTKDGPSFKGDWLQAAWSDQVRGSVLKAPEDASDGPFQLSLVGIKPTGLTPLVNTTALDLDIVSNVNWKRYRLGLRVTLLDQQGRVLDRATTNTQVLSEDAPSLINKSLKFDAVKADDIERIQVDAEVEAQTGVYHGHGMWMTIKP